LSGGEKCTLSLVILAKNFDVSLHNKYAIAHEDSKSITFHLFILILKGQCDGVKPYKIYEHKLSNVMNYIMLGNIYAHFLKWQQTSLTHVGTNQDQTLAIVTRIKCYHCYPSFQLHHRVCQEFVMLETAIVLSLVKSCSLHNLHHFTNVSLFK